jgi:4'-phosphopantetheinyl transferase
MGAGSPQVSQSRVAERSRGVVEPASAEVHLWEVDLDPEPDEAARRFAATTDAERERAARFWRREDGDRHLSAHGALRLVLAEYLACDPLALRFATGEHGKPFLEDTPLEFNLSHSSDLALIAVGCERQVGVDVERVRSVPDLEDLAGRVCGTDELATLAALAEPHRAHAFLTMWTRKEALAKATGEGIGGVMRDGRAGAVERKPWTVVEVNDLPGYTASVAAEGSGWRVVRRNVAALTERR